jgi:hypothetical protein
MGFRYRKSINLGGGFRINLSKSGVGYSWGVKGYRITKTAKGTTRRTASIPGTDISYVHETRKNNGIDSRKGSNSASPKPVPAIDNNHYDTQNIVNNVATAMVSEGLEDMLASASKALKLNKFANVGLWSTAILGFGFPVFFLFVLFFLILKIFVRTKGTIDLDYSIEPDLQVVVNSRINPMIEITKCAKVWRIMQTSKVINRKYAAGASNTVNRIACKAMTKPPFPFKANLEIASFKAGKETLLFLPDKLFIIQKSKIGALNYSDIISSSHTTRFIESEGVAKDTQVVGQTWKYVNKSGGPDRRFKDNRQLPICLYGELELSSTSGLNTVIMYSNPSISVKC